MAGAAPDDQMFADAVDYLADVDVMANDLIGISWRMSIKKHF